MNLSSSVMPLSSLLCPHMIRLTTGVTYGTTHYGVIPPEQWYQPDWIDEDRATKAREKMMGQRVLYAGMPCAVGFFHPP